MVQSGFTLIEVVVSLAILALSLGVLYESFGGSLRRTATVQHQESAWLTAQSILSEVRGGRFVEPGIRKGATPDGLKWESRINLHDAQIDEHSPIKAFEVTIEVSWGSRPAQRVRLESIQTGRVSS